MPFSFHPNGHKYSTEFFFVEPPLMSSPKEVVKAATKCVKKAFSELTLSGTEVQNPIIAIMADRPQAGKEMEKALKGFSRVCDLEYFLN